MNPLMIFKPEVKTKGERISDDENPGQWFVANKGEFRIYMTLFDDDDNGETPKACVSVYKNKENLLNYGGTLKGCLKEVKEIVLSKSNTITILNK